MSGKTVKWLGCGIISVPILVLSVFGVICIVMEPRVALFVGGLCGLGGLMALGLVLIVRGEEKELAEDDRACCANKRGKR